jgi:hypothetical protein
VRSCSQVRVRSFRPIQARPSIRRAPFASKSALPIGAGAFSFPPKRAQIKVRSNQGALFEPERAPPFASKCVFCFDSECASSFLSKRALRIRVRPSHQRALFLQRALFVPNRVRSLFKSRCAPPFGVCSFSTSNCAAHFALEGALPSQQSTLFLRRALSLRYRVNSSFISARTLPSKCAPPFASSKCALLVSVYSSF